MSPDLITRERDTYEELWGVSAYSEVSPGARYVPTFDALVRERCVGRGSVLDAGTGSGQAAVALDRLGYHVTLCDLTPAGLVPEARRFPFVEAALWHDLRPTIGLKDWTYCCDVLEHLPTCYLGLALVRLMQITRRGLFIAVPFVPDVMGHWVGRTLHQTVELFPWWRDRLRELGHLADARDLMQCGLFLVEPPR